MSRMHINIFATLIALVSFCNILVYHRFIEALLNVQSETALFSYNISLAIFTGCVVYLLTSSLPNLINKNERKKLINKELIGFLNYVIERFDSIEDVDFSAGSENVKKQFKALTYSSKAIPTANSSSSIFHILTKINVKKEELFLTCIPLILSVEDNKLLKELRSKVIQHKLFNSRNVYLSKEYDEIALNEVGVGGYIYDLYKVVIEFKKDNESV